jgi:uncharacterized protein (DUF58 family)
VVFLISDFVGVDIDRPLTLLSQRHDVVAVTVEDPSERTLPSIGLARFTDPETGDTIDIDTGDKRVREQYAMRVRDEVRARQQLLRRLAIDEVAMRTDLPLIDPLLRFFRARETRAKRR